MSRKGAKCLKKTEKPSVALIFGGRGFEHDISVRGAEYVFSLIDGSKYRKIPVYITKNGTWLTPILRDLSVCPRAVIDEAVPTEECFPVYRNSVGGIETDTAFIPIISAFPLLHGDFGEDGVVQGALENAMIPYVGCDTQASAVARDKCYVKLVAESLGIPTAKWVYVTGGHTEKSLSEAEEKIGYPAFVKPARLGSSFGTGVAGCRAELESAVASALSVGSGKALIEEYIEVEKELECGYFGTKSKELFTGVGEISYKLGFYDYEAKYFSSSATVSSDASITEDESETIRDYSSRLTNLLGLSGLSRIDFFRARDGKIYFNEINTMPGFTESSLYPRLVSGMGISPFELVNLLIEDASGI